MLALCFHCSSATYITCKTLAPLWGNVYFSRLAPVQLREFPFPQNLPPNWVRVRITQCGLCSSDLHLMSLHLSPAAAPAAVFADPNATTILGHELVGIVEAVNGTSQLQVGQRVISRAGAFRNCFNAGHDADPCPACAAGDYNLCPRQGELTDPIEPIRHGGFASHYIDHVANLIPVPDALSDDQAVLIEPLACSLRAVLRSMGVPPMPSRRILVLGAGMQGLGAIHWVKTLSNDVDISAVARHPYQADLARQLGARTIFSDTAPLADFAQHLNTTVARGPLQRNQLLIGGFDLVIDSLGTPQTLHRSLRLVRPAGKVIVLGAHLSPGKIDYTPLWFREVQVTGTYAHGRENFDGRDISTLQLTIDLLTTRAPLPVNLVTHRFPLDRYRDAVVANQNKLHSKCVRTVLHPSSH